MKLKLKASFIITITVVFSALALPKLQLDIEGGTYDAGSETVITNDQVFTLYALLKDAGQLDETFYISAALSPKVGPENYDLGSFSIDGNIIDATEDMVYGNPPIEDNLAHDGRDLSPHDIFDTFFYEHEFSFSGAEEVSAYNVEPGQTASGTLYRMAFQIDVSQLDPEYNLHFDLYNTVVRNNGDIDRDDFAPFSHDAEYVSVRQVPEPGIVILVGFGILGLSGFRGIRKRKS